MRTQEMERIARWIYGDTRSAIQMQEYDPMSRARRLMEEGHGEYAEEYAEATAQMLEDYAQRHRQAAKMVRDAEADEKEGLHCRQSRQKKRTPDHRD